MEHNLPTDPEFRRTICALKGIPYTDPDPQPLATRMVAGGRSEETYTAAELQALIEVTVTERMHAFEQRMTNMMTNQQGLALLRTVEDLRWRVRDLEGRLSKPLDPRGQLPDLHEITKLHVQLFDNQKHPPKQIGKKRSTIANQLLKLYAWTCPREDITQYAEGTCGNFYMPMYVPNTAYTRKRIGDQLDYLGADDARLIGCLTNSKYSKRQQADQAAMLSDKNHLWLHIRGELVDCGLPRPAPGDAQAHAAIFHWYWPDVLG
jgi:hypothetical protein